MRDPDRYLPDPGADADDLTDADVTAAAESIDLDDWIGELLCSWGTDAALLAWARRCYAEAHAAKERAREADRKVAK